MKKKTLSLALALALCLGLCLFAVPASAAGATVTEIVSPDTYVEFLKTTRLGPFSAGIQGFSEGITWHGTTWTGYGAFDANGNVIVPPNTYSEVMDFHEGVAWGQRSSGLWVAVDTSGRELFSLEGFTYSLPHDFSDGLALVTVSSASEGPRVGYVDKTGQLVIPFASRSKAGDFHDGLALAYDAANAYYGYIDKTGQVVIPYQYSNAKDFENGFAQVWQGNRRMVIDTTGKEVVLPEGYEVTSWFSPELLVAYISGSGPRGGYALINKSGQILSNIYTEPPLSYGEGLYLVRNEVRSLTYQYGYVNEAGVEIVPCTLNSAGIFRDGYALAQTGSAGNRNYNYSVYDKTGKVTGTWTGSAATSAGNGCFQISSSESGKTRYGFIDYTGREIVPPKYQKVGAFSNGIAPVQDFTGNWGFVDTTGAEVVPCKLSGCVAHSKAGVFEVYNFNDDGRWSIVRGSGWTAPTATAPAATARVSAQTVPVDGRPVEFQMYALWDDNGGVTNYIKLRDIAYILNGSAAQFEVSWDSTTQSANLLPGKPYTTANGTEMNTPFSGDRAYKPSAASILINGAAVSLEAITLTDDSGGEYNYYKLRDLGQALNFNVSWVDNQVVVNTDQPYDTN